MEKQSVVILVLGHYPRHRAALWLDNLERKLLWYVKVFKLGRTNISKQTSKKTRKTSKTSLARKLGRLRMRILREREAEGEEQGIG